MKGRVGGGGDPGDLLEQGHVLRLAAELVVADQSCRKGAPPNMPNSSS